MVGLPRWCSGKESACQCRRLRRPGFDPWVGKIPEKEVATCSSISAWRAPWTEELGGLYSPWGRKESDTTEQLSTHDGWLKSDSFFTEHGERGARIVWSLRWLSRKNIRFIITLPWPPHMPMSTADLCGIREHTNQLGLLQGPHLAHPGGQSAWPLPQIGRAHVWTPVT